MGGSIKSLSTHLWIFMSWNYQKIQPNCVKTTWIPTSKLLLLAPRAVSLPPRQAKNHDALGTHGHVGTVAPWAGMAHVTSAFRTWEICYRSKAWCRNGTPKWLVTGCVFPRVYIYIIICIYIYGDNRLWKQKYYQHTISSWYCLMGMGYNHGLGRIMW
jgi:hypothetical protein